MKWFGKLTKFVLPREVDIFGNLVDQCAITRDATDILHRIYIEKSEEPGTLRKVIRSASQLRMSNLMQLNEMLITPIDKEAISRLYLTLDWICLSIKHLDVEIQTYNISSLAEYEKIFSLLCEQMKKMNDGFTLLKQKQYEEVLKNANDVIQLDDEVIKEYSLELANLFSGEALKHILRHKEILSQLKEVSKRIHVSANNLEDVVYKMH